MKFRKEKSLLFLSLLIVFFSSCSKKDTPTPLPTVTAISQSLLSPSASFTLTGANFSTTASNDIVNFGTTPVVVTTATATTLTLTLPATFATGSYVVTVAVNEHIATLPGNVDVTPDAPSITSFTPASTALGASVTITGTNFNTIAANNIVKFGTVVAAVTNATATTLTTAVPAGLAPGSYPITIVVSANNESSSTATSATQFAVLPAAPTIASFTPAQGAQGSTVTITGTNFNTTAANNTVKFGTVAATVINATATALTTTVPATLAAGTYPITVVTSVNGQTSAMATSGTQFAVIFPAPTITNFTPASGGVGSIVTITGTNFNATSANNTVKFGTLAATVTNATATTLTATVPATLTVGTSYPINVSVSLNGQSSTIATSAASFSVIIPTPTITNFTPSSTQAGGSIVISGTNFSTVAANNTVKFGTVAATVTNATATTLTATVPSTLTVGTSYPINVSVSLNGQSSATATSTTSFSVINPAPTISNFTPSSTQAGSSIVISGTNFSTVAGNNIVQFSNVGSVFNGTVTNATATQLTVTIPDMSSNNVTTYAVFVSVSFSGQTPSTATAQNIFTYILPTAIASFSPSIGSTGTTVTIIGTNFDPTPANNVVTFQGVSQPSPVQAIVTQATSTSLIVSVPSGVYNGNALISIKVDGGVIATSSSEFFVNLPPPTITNFSPSSGSAGTTVTITGTNFDSTPTNNMVSINGGATIVVTQATSTSLTFTIPSGSFGGSNPIQLTVDGQEVTSASSFNVIVPTPTITNFTPASGPVGTTVIITGTNFDPTPGNNQVYFIGGGASTPTIVTQSTTTSLTITVPSGAATGTIWVYVNGVPTISSSSFTVQ